MTKIRDLYYAAWANLSGFSMHIRAAIVLAVLVIFAWIIARPLFFKLLRLLLRATGGLTKLICLIGGKILGVTARRSPEQYAARYNRMVDLAGRWNERLLNWSNRLAGKRKFYPGQMLLLYGVLMLLVGLPALLEPVISKEYMSYFSFASDLYQKMEAPTLEAAAAYSPLIANNGGVTVEVSDPEDEPAPGEALPQEVWLSLSEAGQNGSNVRAGPGTDNQVLSVVSGDAQVLYLEERSGRWVRVRMADGIEGWIHDSLVTGIPEETPGRS